VIIIGAFSKIAWVDTETGEASERRMAHREEAEQFYCELQGRGLSVRVGMEASGHARWLERLLRDLLATARKIRPSVTLAATIHRSSASQRSEILYLPHIVAGGGFSYDQ
jgi:hypothetical protein